MEECGDGGSGRSGLGCRGCGGDYTSVGCNGSVSGLRGWI